MKIDINELIKDTEIKYPTVFKRRNNKKKFELFYNQTQDAKEALELLFFDNGIEDIIKDCNKKYKDVNAIGRFIKTVGEIQESEFKDKPLSNDNNFLLVKPFINMGPNKLNRYYTQAVSIIIKDFNLTKVDDVRLLEEEIKKLNSYILLIDQIRTNL